MRTALSVAALAAGALAVPYHKRDVVHTDWDIVYVTDVVTVTAGAGQAPAAYTTAASSSELSVAQHYGHHWHSQAWTSTVESVWTEAAPTPSSTSIPAPAYTPSSTSTPAPAYTPETSSTPAAAYTPESTPAPEPETTSTSSAYQIPLTTFVSMPSPVYAAPSSSAAPSSAGGYSGNTAYSKKVVDSHNLHRSNHSAPDIEWDDGLASIAAITAQTCKYAHDTTTGGGGYGQNIAAGVDDSSIMNVITDMFYNGEEWQFSDAGLYGQANPDMSNFEAWGHFTQLVWKETTHVGCYTQKCSTLHDSDGNALSDSIPPYFTVCNYKNPGNFAGEYADNVGKPLGNPVVWAASESS